MNNKEWTATHTQLYQLMKKEMETMRHLLENMHQEEFFILKKEKTYWVEMMKERAQLISELSYLRKHRLLTIEILESKLFPSISPIAFENLLPVDHDNSWEILILRDQISALLDRLNLQTTRNQLLTQIDEYHMSPDKSLSNASKKKTMTTTLPIEKDNTKKHDTL